MNEGILTDGNEHVNTMNKNLHVYNWLKKWIGSIENLINYAEVQSKIELSKPWIYSLTLI